MNTPKRSALAARTSALALAFVALGNLPSLAGDPLLGGSRNIRRNQVTSGGTLLASAGNTLNLETYVGEAAVSTYTSAANGLHSGLGHVSAQPATVVSITAVTKDTDTLTLRWTSPGADGFQGDITGGFCRVDASSDPLHLFSPEIFLTEFSTSVAANSLQSFQLTGLLPNTTYYTKVYLAESRKYFSEDSAAGIDSTLAKLVINPVFSGVFSSSVTIAWNLPAGGAEGFISQADTAAFTGGTIFSSATNNGSVLTLTITGLAPATTYFFRVGSLNWQSDQNFTVLMTTMTLSPGIPPVFNLAVFGDSTTATPTATLSWSNPAFAGFTQVVVVQSTNSSTNLIQDGTAYTPGQTLGDGSVVESVAITTGVVNSGLRIDQQYYYFVYTASGTGPLYSVAVTTSVIIDEAPMEVAGLIFSTTGGVFSASWTAPTSHYHGQSFVNPSSATANEYDSIIVQTSTTTFPPLWTTQTVLSSSTVNHSFAITNEVFVTLRTNDQRGNNMRAIAMNVIDGNYYSFSTDGITRMIIPPSLFAGLTVPNKIGSNLIMRNNERTPQDSAADPTRRTYHSTDFFLVKSPTAEPVPTFQFPTASAQLAMHYTVSNGQVVPGTANDPGQLGMFWNNGSQYVPLFGSVDTGNQTVTVQTAMQGIYQVRGILRPGGLTFDLNGLSNKAITPNGDGINDKVVFTFDNPQYSSVTGEIFDITGAKIADLAAGPIPNTTLQWDARADGRVVSSGVYIYQIKGEGKTFNGTVVVIR